MLVPLVGISIFGKLILFFVGQFPPIKTIKSEFWHKLLNCSLCFGVWVFFFLCCLLRFEVVGSFIGVYIPILNEFISGMALSFLVHLLSLGWKLQFSEFKVLE